MESRRWEICNIDVQKASYAKHLGSKNNLVNELVLPKLLFQKPIRNKIKNIYNPKALKEVARKYIKINDIILDKERAKKMINPYYFTDRALQVDFDIELDTHHTTYASFIVNNKPKIPEFGI